MSSPSATIVSIITRILGRETGSGVGPLRFRQLGGGSINTAYQVITCDNSLWFCKINGGPFPDLFARETQGLQLLGRQGLIRVPAVIGCETVEGIQVLILEWISEGPRTPAFWTRFGEQLAQLHAGTNNFRSDPPRRPSSASPSSSSPSPPANSSAPHPSNPPSSSPSIPPSDPSPGHNSSHPFGLDSPHSFGLDEDNYIGSLPQSNAPAADWPGFFIAQRLQAQLRLSVDRGLLGPDAVRKFESLYQALPDIFAGDPPSLLHGDLCLPERVF